MFIWLRARFHPICNTLFCLALVLSLSGTGLADEPQEELADTLIYLPLVLKPPSTPPTEAAGVLDPEFGGDGLVTTNIYQSDDEGRALLIQPDGKLVVGGYGEYGRDDFELARYHPDGSLDLSFSGDGKVVTDFALTSSLGDNRIYALALQSDGRILAAGHCSDDFAIARYLPDGNLDPSFDGDGWLMTHFTAGNAYIYGIALQADGKIVAAGSAGADFALARYHPDGTLDTSFDGDGWLITSFNTGNDIARAVVLQPDGKIVVAGYTFTDTATDYALARYKQDGSLDPEFSTDGKLTTDFASTWDNAYAVALQPDGKIVAAGSGGEGEFGLARYNANGTLDGSFDGDGKLSTAITDTDGGAYAIALQPDGKIVVGGFTRPDLDYNFALARYHPDGSLDTSLDGDGMVITDFQNRYDYGYALALQTDGKIVMAGNSYASFAVARFTPDGSPDPSFSQDGQLTTDFFGLDDEGYDVTLQPDGKLLVAGTAEGSTDGMIVLRYLPDGSLDPDFHGGWVTVSYSLAGAWGYAVAYQADGKVLAAGSTSTNTATFDFLIARFLADGSPDNSFSGDCITTIDFNDYHDQAYDMVIQSDGKILVAGYANNGSNNDFALARINPAGYLDTSFSTDGKLTTDFGGTKDVARSIAVQPDGKIVVAGYAGDNFALARYNPDGTLDTSFSGDGKLTTDYMGGTDAAYSVIIQPDSKILVAGYANNGSNHDFALARYNPDGTLDTSFSGDGKQSTDFFGYGDAGRSVVLQPNGKIVVAGSAFDGTSTNFAVARYHPDGSLDTSLDLDGKVTTDFSGFADYGYSVALQSDGKMVVVGYIADDIETNIALARYK